jgi:predicted dehydrogenase
MTITNDISFLIAGLGSIGRRHLQNLGALGISNITLLRTGKGTLSDELFDRFPVEHDLDAALARKPSAVIVSNPTSLHLNVAIPATKAGCHLLLEKPVSHSMERIAELREIASRKRLKVLVGFQFRFHPSLRQVKTWIDDGTIGRPISAHAHWGEYLPAWHPWEDYRASYSSRHDLGGGVALTLCHPIDYLRWLAGDVTSVYASMDHSSSLETDTEDRAVFVLKFASGALGTVYLDYVRQPPAHELLIIGERGTISWNAADNNAVLSRASRDETETYSPPVGFERNSLFLSELSHFISCISEDTEPLCSLEDGIRTLEIVLAAKESSAERREVDVS